MAALPIGAADQPTLERLVGSLHASDFPGVLDAVDRWLSAGAQREYWRKQAILRWAQVSPAAAISFAWEFIDGPECYLFTCVTEEWLRHDPATALKAVRNLSAGPLRDEVFAMSLREFTRQNPEAAFEFLQSLPSGGERSAAIYSIAVALAEESPDLTLMLAETLPESPQRSDAVLTAVNAVSVFPSL